MTKENKKGNSWDDERAKKSFERFKKITSPDNAKELIIVKAHLEVEYYLDQIILCYLPRGDIIAKNLSFYKKWLLVKSMKSLPEVLMDSIKGLNEVRNHCAHELNYQVSSSDIDRIGAPFGSDYLNKKDELKNNKELMIDTLMMLIAPLAREVHEIKDKFSEK